MASRDVSCWDRQHFFCTHIVTKTGQVRKFVAIYSLLEQFILWGVREHLDLSISLPSTSTWKQEVHQSNFRVLSLTTATWQSHLEKNSCIWKNILVISLTCTPQNLVFIVNRKVFSPMHWCVMSKLISLYLFSSSKIKPFSVPYFQHFICSWNCQWLQLS